MLTPEECKAAIQFLDRVTLTGHNERTAMNAVVQKIAQMSVPKVSAPSTGNDSEEETHA